MSDGVIILQMMDYKGFSGFYHVPQHWLDWYLLGVGPNALPNGWPPIPEDLLALHVEENGRDSEDTTVELYEMRDFKFFALDTNAVADDIKSLIKWLDGREITQELEGCWD